MRERFMFALRAAGAVAVFWSNLLLLVGALSLYALYTSSDTSDFRFGLSFPLGYNKALPALILWKMLAVVTLFIVLLVFTGAFFRRENIDVPSLRAFVRLHPGRVYFVYPYRLLRYVAVLLAPRASTPR